MEPLSITLSGLEAAALRKEEAQCDLYALWNLQKTSYDPYIMTSRTPFFPPSSETTFNMTDLKSRGRNKFTGIKLLMTHFNSSSRLVCRSTSASGKVVMSREVGHQALIFIQCYGANFWLALMTWGFFFFWNAFHSRHAFLANGIPACLFWYQAAVSLHYLSNWTFKAAAVRNNTTIVTDSAQTGLYITDVTWKWKCCGGFFVSGWIGHMTIHVILK